ncbi:LytR C-terminal domain-containing protein [Nocardioides bruguierae]|uniref:LytR C-terminal domain-containing protein n=1 Tax=Nocardioides bruguierae TaxID=2945102 RepID=A0A9X2IE25_9ACTN|nr:LytR C-terminal domain-containing protein [Nocardioides bruguierae]MCM0619837.1 LytR C-terminal domain-containing protein [Nocardioides bruguierae]
MGPRSPEAPDRGAVLPTPVLLLSLAALVLAGVAWVTTSGSDEAEREITTASDASTSATADPSASATDGSSAGAGEESETAEPSEEPSATRTRKPVNRSKTYVEVYNNSSISGLAGEVATSATDVGWNVVGADNWYGTIPANTVYYPARLEREAKLLARDLGIDRVVTASDPMKMDRLTVILTGELD